MFSDTPEEKLRGQTVARIGLGLGLLALGVFTLQGFLSALAWAVVFAVALWPFFIRAETRLRPRPGSWLLPVLFTGLVALLFIVPLALVAVELSQEAVEGLHWLGQAQREGVPEPGWLSRLPVGAAQAHEWWRRTLEDPGGIRRWGNQVVAVHGVSVSRYLGLGLGVQLLHRVVLFGFTLLTLLFLFRDGREVTAQAARASARVFGPRGERIGRQMIDSIRGTVSGLVLVGVGQGVILGVAYAIAGVPHATVLGTLTAVAAMIPFGAPVAYGVASLLLLADGSPGRAVAVFATGSVVLFIADHFIRPALIGGSTKLPFLWVLLGILGGVEEWGLLGLFLGPAIMAALILLWRELSERRPETAA